MLVLVGEQMQLHAVAADNCELGGFAVTVGQFKAKGVSIESDAFLDIASRDQWRDWSRPCIPVPPALVNQSLFLSESAWRQVL
jgi:hypothetical protein